MGMGNADIKERGQGIQFIRGRGGAQQRRGERGYKRMECGRSKLNGWRGGRGAKWKGQ